MPSYTSRSNARYLIEVREIVNDLLLAPPETLDEVGDALTGVDREAIAEIVIEVVSTDRLNPFDDEILAEVTHAADERKAVDGLLGIAADERATLDRRAVAWYLAIQIDHEQVHRHLGDMEPELRAASTQRMAQAVLMQLEMDPSRLGAEICESLLALDDERRERVWAAYEAARAVLGTPVGLVYRDVIGHPELAALADRLDAALDAAPDADAVAAVECALHRAPPGEAKRRLRRRLMALRTAAANSPPARPSARVWVTGCDGRGSFWLYAEVARPNNGLVGGYLCLRASGELRTSSVKTRPDRAAHERERVELASLVGAWVPIDPAAAAALVTRSAEMADHVPEEAAAGLALLRRLYRPGDTPPEAATPGPPSTLSELQAHLEHLPGRSWHLGHDELMMLGLSSPPREGADETEAWCDQVLAAVVEHGFTDRWAQMADQLAWWLVLNVAN